MSAQPPALALLAVLLLPRGPTPQTSDPEEAPEAEDARDGTVTEIVVKDERPSWLFPGLDHPRVQAYFRSASMLGPSLFDAAPLPPRPLVRAGSVRVHGAADRQTKRLARRFARSLVADVRPALEACYVDVLARSPTDAARLTLALQLGAERGPVHLAAGQLGDVYGNACVLGVLEFAEREGPALEGVALEIPVWFWLQSQ
ncbi:hypothetical protein G6O69_21710 [Pseudenhygromyxa sp. WMMC2535]|uniref:hypothetical protein n=1 Tax=Pseudenhygromyxa sp. WMMC2535 TaxID=2712867 RepID=UPI001557583E|nr:hypothetical protein [Pseudenhygromyxa sp. WMMC2535]NVB40472.1 hypothetical protein [Pseudenhygromyxa sp. WMMC2535]